MKKHSLSLHVEVDILTDTYNSIYDSFDDFQSLSVDNQRNKRSLIPIVGQFMSKLFGTVSENDLDNINRNVKALASNQKQIIHDLDVSLSVLNLTRMQVAENRWLVGCFGFNGPLRQYLSLYRAVSQREGEGEKG